MRTGAAAAFTLAGSAFWAAASLAVVGDSPFADAELDDFVRRFVEPLVDSLVERFVERFVDSFVDSIVDFALAGRTLLRARRFAPPGLCPLACAFLAGLRDFVALAMGVHANVCEASLSNGTD